MDVEGGEGQHDEAEDKGDQDNQHQRGGEGLEELLSHLRDAGAAAAATRARATGARVATAAGVGGSKGPVEETRRQRQPQLLGRPGTHRRWAGRGRAHQTSSLGQPFPPGKKRTSPRHPKLLPGAGGDARASEGLREQPRTSKPARKRAVPRRSSLAPPGTRVRAPFSSPKAPGCKENRLS